MPLKFELPKLPYGLGDLEPVINKDIMDLHYNKHHATYVANLNKALEQYEEAEKNKDAEKMISLQPAIKFNGGGNLITQFFGPT
jgi:Fe-Mn family superoxide dismutase